MKRSITNQDTLVSGGAVGADDQFTKCAQTRGDAVEICLGKKQKYSKSSDDHKVIRVGHDDYKDELESLAILLRRRVPKNEYVRNLLARNVEIATRVESLYAVGKFEDKARSRLKIAGGTAWACEAFADRVKDGTTTGTLLFFCTVDCCWHKLSDNLEWVRVDKVPHPKGKYGGIGSRELGECGVDAIYSLYQSASKRTRTDE